MTHILTDGKQITIKNDILNEATVNLADTYNEYMERDLSDELFNAYSKACKRFIDVLHISEEDYQSVKLYLKDKCNFSPLN